MDALAEASFRVHPDTNMDSDMIDDDERSSSLSDIEDDGESPGEETPVQMDPTTEADSEAETERIESTPNKMGGSKKMILNTKPFEPSPSKLVQATGPESGDDDDSDSAISSPLASTRDSVTGDVVDGEDDNTQDLDGAAAQERVANAKKRKRSLIDGDDPVDSAQDRLRRRRIGSVKAEVSIHNDAVSEDGSLSSRERTLEPTEEQGEAVHDAKGNANEVDTEQELTTTAKDTKGKAVVSRRRPLRGKTIEIEVSVHVDGIEQQDAESEAEEAADNEDLDDVEAAARSEEELAKKMAAMEALTNLERHFAALRDRLYDERIASINTELTQLASKRPAHPELLRQLKIVEKYRDDKFDIEQKLLVHKVGALKRKSVAERAEIHSSYFQTVRDLREKHLEKISEHFYRIQRERFKTEDPIPNYTIPFSRDRTQQISQQIAYNREVSILSGIAKYVGFPAAPELSDIRGSELDHDLSKMGISANTLKTGRQTVPASFSATLSRPAASWEEQTPWANPQHPLSQHLQRMSRHVSEQSRVQETPAMQRPENSLNLQNSASTIPEPNNSAAASSAFNTPFGDQVTHAPLETAENRPLYRVHSASPTESRKLNTGLPNNEQTTALGQRRTEPLLNSSPPISKMAPAIASPRPAPNILDRIPRHDNASPLDMHRTNPGILASGIGGLGRFGMR